MCAPTVACRCVTLRVRESAHGSQSLCPRKLGEGWRHFRQRSFHSIILQAVGGGGGFTTVGQVCMACRKSLHFPTDGSDRWSWQPCWGPGGEDGGGEEGEEGSGERHRGCVCLSEGESRDR